MIKEGFAQITGSKSKTFLTFCFCFLFGIIIGSLYNSRIDFLWAYCGAFIFIILFIVFWQKRTFLFLVICLLFLAFGFTRYTFALPQPFDVPIDERTFIAVVASEPDVRQDGIRYIVKTNKIQKTRHNVRNRVYMTTGLYPRYAYGDVLEITCRLQKPEQFDGFRYDMYLLRLGVTLACWNPAITKVGESEENFTMRHVLRTKQFVANQVNALWHEPYAGFMAGLLYGYRGGLGPLTEQFHRTGVTHIIAISGYNIAIIVQVLMIVSSYCWIPRQKAFWGISFLLLLFVLFTGVSGSVVRAAVMGFLLLMAQQFGRLSRITNALIFTAAIMTLQNPFLLAWDVGFQLSFLALAGLVFISPIILAKLKNMPGIFGMKETFVATLSATLMTFPLILFQFGTISIVAILVNALILWIIPWIMLTGFVSITTSFLVYSLGQCISWFSWIGMKYVVIVVTWFAHWQWASVQFHVPLWPILLMYFLISGSMYVFHKRDKTPAYSSQAILPPSKS